MARALPPRQLPITATLHPPRRGRGPGIAARFAPPPPSGLRIRGTPTTIIGVAKQHATAPPRVIPAHSPGS